MLSSYPALLIIVPTLNSYKVLPRLVKSLKSQTFGEWRLLFVDGPSSKAHCNWIRKVCKEDNRITSIKQNKNHKGIYGAMNQGLTYAAKKDWILFWGSDDWAFSKDTFAEIINLIKNIEKNNNLNTPDLIVARGFYIDANNGKLKRITRFDESRKYYNNFHYFCAMLLGNTPPHQATIIGPGARLTSKIYSNDFYLTADLDFFLSLMTKKNLNVQIMKSTIVNIGDSGVSSRWIKLRFSEVLKTYFKHFKIFFFMPYIARYLKRIMSKRYI